MDEHCVPAAVPRRDANAHAGRGSKCSRGGCSDRQGQGGAFPTNGLAADHFEPCSPDATAWPVFPEHWSKRQWGRRVYACGKGSRERGGERPKHCTHSPRLDAGTAFLTLGTQGAAATMTDASSIQDPQGAITLGAAFLWISGRSAGQCSVPSGCGVKAEPGKPLVKEGRAHWGGPYWAGDACFSERAGSMTEAGETSDAGANSVVSSSEEESVCPSSRRRFHTHCAKIWQNSWP